MDHNSYVSGYKLNYTTDTDNSSNSMKSNNSLFTSIQQMDSKLSLNTDQKIKGENGQSDNGYFKRLKFSTSSFLKRFKYSKSSGETLITSSNEKNNNNNGINSNIVEIPPLKREYHQLSITRPLDSLGLSFRKKKKEVNFQEDTHDDLKSFLVKKDYTFLDRMSVSERCSISLECKNNIISIEGHKKHLKLK